MQFGFAGLLNFGHVASMAVSAYTMAILVVQAGVSLWLASLAGIGAAVVFAVLLGLPTLRLRADYLAITTIAFGEIVRYVALNATALTGGSQGTINLAGAGNIAYYNTAWSAFQARAQDWLAALIGSAATPDATMLALVWAVALAAVVAVWLLGRSPWGRVLRSLREDEDAAASLGKNVFAYKLQALVAGAVLGGLAGLFYAYQFSFFSPDDFAPLATFFAWTIVILGRDGTGVGRAGRVARLRLPLRGHALLRLSPVRVPRLGGTGVRAPHPDRADPDRADGVPSAGAARQAAGDGA